MRLVTGSKQKQHCATRVSNRSLDSCACRFAAVAAPTMIEVSSSYPEALILVSGEAELVAPTPQVWIELAVCTAPPASTKHCASV
jgi:hypothetical protein